MKKRESLYNPSFKPAEFGRFREGSGLNSFDICEPIGLLGDSSLVSGECRIGRLLLVSLPSLASLSCAHKEACLAL